MGTSLIRNSGGTVVVERSPFSKLYENAMEKDADILTLADEYKLAFQKDDKSIYWIDDNLAFVDYAKTIFEQGGIKIIRNLSDLPEPINNIITIGPNENYLLTDNLDLEDNELRVLEYTSITGRSQQTSRITGNSLTGNLLRLEGTVILKNFYLDIPSGKVGIFADGSIAGGSYDWRDLNFFGGGTALCVKNINNMTLDTCGFFDTSMIEIQGQLDSLIINTSICVLTQANQFGIKTSNGFQLNRRIRFSESPIFVGSGAVGLDLSVGTFPFGESVRLREVSFSGPGEYLRGVDYKSDFARFNECRGIINSKRFCSIYYQGTALVIPSPRNVEVFPPLLGNIGQDNQRFSYDFVTNEVIYEGQFETFFKTTCVFTTNTTTSNKQIQAYLKLNDQIIPGATCGFFTFSGNRPVNGTITSTVRLKQGDRIRFAWQNLSGGAIPSIGFSDYSLTVEEM